jgi:uncharacterized membrane protein
MWGLVAGVVGQIGLPLDTGANASIPWQYTPSTASTILATIIGATAALTGFVVTVTVLIVQMATGTFSARYMRLWHRGRMLKARTAGPQGLGGPREPRCYSGTRRVGG